MAKQKEMSPAEINRRMKQEMDEMRRKYKKRGMDDMEIESLMRDFFVEKKPAKKASTMTAAKGGVAKKRMARGGAVKKAAPKKMMRGGVAKKKMARGGYSKKK